MILKCLQILRYCSHSAHYPIWLNGICYSIHWKMLHAKHVIYVTQKCRKIWCTKRNSITSSLSLPSIEFLATRNTHKTCKYLSNCSIIFQWKCNLQWKCVLTPENAYFEMCRFLKISSPWFRCVLAVRYSNMLSDFNVMAKSMATASVIGIKFRVILISPKWFEFLKEKSNLS